MAKPKIATAWMAGCAGCHMSFLDIDERILDVVKLVDITTSPITDFKHFEDVDIGIVEGTVNTTKDEEVLRDLRAHCKILMAWGDCACFGGIVASRNPFDKTDCLRRGYIETESTVHGKIPSSDEIPRLLDKAKPANHVVKVDCFVPGCPPNADSIYYALVELLNGRIPVLPANMMRFD
ncbi:MAG: NADP oxidoreductase [Dehalococcoidia bacterium]|nr:NADP oxidoreductase [Dehalococcoidia bacterium]